MNKRINTGIDIDLATNRAACFTLAGTLAIVVYGIVQRHDLMEWLPNVLIGLMSAFSQTLQGKPSQKTQMLASILRLNGNATNAELLRSAIDRLLSSGVVPGLSQNSQQARVVTTQQDRYPSQSSPQPNQNQSIDRQRPRSYSQPMTRQQWNDWNQSDSWYPEIIQTGIDPDELGPSTERR